MNPPAPTIPPRIPLLSSGRSAWRGGRVMRSGSGGSRSKAIDVDRSMNSSIHRIWSGRRTWRSATKIVDTRMKPRNATWVETTKIRPFWTLSTIRRPSARPNIRVANESSPRTRSEASRATAVPLPIATATSAPWSAGASFTPSPVTATIRWSARAARTRRSFCSGVDRATTWRSDSSAASRTSSQPATSSPVTIRSASRPASRAIVAAVRGWSPVTTMTPMPAPLAMASASAIPGRMGSANPISARIRHGPPSTLRASATSRSPAAAASSISAAQRSRSAPPDSPPSALPDSPPSASASA